MVKCILNVFSQAFDLDSNHTCEIYDICKHFLRNDKHDVFLKSSMQNSKVFSKLLFFKGMNVKEVLDMHLWSCYAQCQMPALKGCFISTTSVHDSY